MAAASATGRDPGDTPDPAFAARFAVAYRGRHDPADALHWLRHPDTDGPSGAGPPGAPAAALRRAVYSARATPDDTAALGALLRQLERDRSDAEAAAAAASTTAPTRDTSSVPAAAARPVDAGSAPHSRPRHRTLLLAGVATAGLVIGAGAVLGRAAVPAEAGPVPSLGTAVVTGRAPFSVLQRPHTAADRPSALLGPDLVASSLRRVAALDDPATVFYLGRDRLGDVCLVAASVYYRASCAPDSVAGARGLALVWSPATEQVGSTRTVIALLDATGRLRIGRGL